MGDPLWTPGTADKTTKLRSWTGAGKVWTVFRTTGWWPLQRVLTDPVRKEWLPRKEKWGFKVAGSKLGVSRFFCCGISVKNLPFLFRLKHTKPIYLRDVLVDCAFVLHLKVVTWTQYIKDPPGWRQALKTLCNHMTWSSFHELFGQESFSFFFSALNL